MEKVVYRQIALPVSAFDYLKQYQRDSEATTRTRTTNSEALTAILREHRQFTIEAREGCGNGNTRHT